MPNPIENYKRTLDICLERIHNNVAAFAGQFPFIGCDDHFILGANDHWMASFWTGELWLAYAITNDDFYRDTAVSQLDRNIAIAGQNKPFFIHELANLDDLMS